MFQSKYLFGTGLAACLSLGGFSPSSTVQAETPSFTQDQQQSLTELSDILGIDVSATLCSRQNQSSNALSWAPQKMVQASGSITAPKETASSSEIMDHSHIPVAVPDGAPVPRLSISLSPDVMSGYNLSIKTQNYKFMPPPYVGQTMESLMEPVKDPETGYLQGHAHLYVNGVKVQRVYGENVHLPAKLFNNGINQLNVTINNHAHMYWTHDNKKIISSMFITTTLPQLIVHEFQSFPVEP